MAESANTLFHFTTIRHLKGILKKRGFLPNYYLEDLSNATPYKSELTHWYVPMVCFCDLPLSRIRKHISFYGEYGIGLRKDTWGIERGMSPIIYLPDVSFSSIGFRNMTEKSLKEFYKYIKAYKGKAWHKRRRKDLDVTFYHEREWRYSPEQFSVLSQREATKVVIEEENNKMKQTALGFNTEDIKYIIVKTEKDIPKFSKFIQKEIQERKDDTERNLLISKLISVEQIREDM